MSDIKRIGFIGIGNMGAPMAAIWSAPDTRSPAYDIAPERRATFAEAHGGARHRQPAELGPDADLIVTMLPTGREVRHALLEAEAARWPANLSAGASSST